ncbi:hypothetical protein AFE_1765 [Acidithiobacillus ferrooxidans ATCC 23270]|uniref:Uncharacterized protein n=1 Tax=Acidithiobacillus ferrooxidans (strain ATCC 23270 / DSM 14882 / CIP 104768 / NCIMB 8455) TaxID=243159 RepID=B7JBM2_ACIF2|nr:hypothetical protein AFE_1765 [Acidithiobacillus ferrooxidans ATCC 23270]
MAGQTMRCCVFSKVPQARVLALGEMGIYPASFRRFPGGVLHARIDF